MKMFPYCRVQCCCNTLGGEMLRTRDKKTRFRHLWVTWPKLFSVSPTELSFSWTAIVQILRMHFEFKFSLEHCDELAVSLSARVRKIHALKGEMILNGYFHMQKIEGLREFIICTAYTALRKRTHTLWSKSISMELNFQRRREDQSFDGGNCISNQSFSNHLLHAIPLCNQKKFISNASSQGSIIKWHFCPNHHLQKETLSQKLGFIALLRGWNGNEMSTAQMDSFPRFLLADENVDHLEIVVLFILIHIKYQAETKFYCFWGRAKGK